MKKLLVVLFAMLFMFGMATSAYAAYSTGSGGTPGTLSPTGPYDSSYLGTGDLIDNSEGNANDTGNTTGDGTTDNEGNDVNLIIKSDNMTTLINGTPATQQTHGNYQNNTNSCASCHQTHTADYDALLFKGGIYETCTACHDGTLGFYNVFADINMGDPAGELIPSAGSFGALEADNSGNPSVHLCNGISAQISAAPGGNRAPLSDNDNGRWTAQFDCAECHSPHGSYSDRLLHYSPNGLGSVPVAMGGQSAGVLTAVYNYGALPAPTVGGEFILVRGTAAQLGIAEDLGGLPAVALFRSVDTNPYTRDNTAFGSAFPWLTDSALTGGADVDIVFGKGYAVINSGTVTGGTINRAYVTKLFGPLGSGFEGRTLDTIDGVAVKAVDTGIYDEEGYGQAITAYCAACHVDYKSGGVKFVDGSPEGTGVYNQAMRHITTEPIVSCLKCHYAHGTNVNVMADAQDNTVASLVYDGKATEPAAIAYMTDKNPSSALKRYTNMAVCWKCHSTAVLTELLVNNQSYWDNKIDGNVPTADASGNW